MNGTSATSFEQSYRIIAQKAFPGRATHKAAELLPLVLDWLEGSKCGSWLMIVDNADDNDAFFPKNFQADNPFECAKGGLVLRYFRGVLFSRKIFFGLFVNSPMLPPKTFLQKSSLIWTVE